MVSTYLTFNDGSFSHFYSSNGILETAIFLLLCREGASYRSPEHMLFICFNIFTEYVAAFCCYCSSISVDHISFLGKGFDSFSGKVL